MQLSPFWESKPISRRAHHWFDFHCYWPFWSLCGPCDRPNRSSWSRSRCRPWGGGGSRWCRWWRGPRSRRSSIPLLRPCSSPPPLPASLSTELPGSTSVPRGQCPWRGKLMFYSTSEEKDAYSRISSERRTCKTLLSAPQQLQCWGQGNGEG